MSPYSVPPVFVAQLYSQDAIGPAAGRAPNIGNVGHMGEPTAKTDFARNPRDFNESLRILLA